MSGRDRISELPECLITQILSHLPIKESMKTSVLATSWKKHWFHVPVLELKYKDFSSQEGLFISFIDRFLTESSTLQKFKVKSSIVGVEKFTDQIGRVINRGIQHLDLKGCEYYIEDDGVYYPYNDIMPLNFYTCKALVSLKLSCFALQDGVVQLPCFKVMDLRKIRWVAPMTLEKFLSGCPVLKELTLRRYQCDEPLVMCVKSRSLKRFCVPFTSRYFTTSSQKYTLEIDAPELEYLSIKQDHFNRIVVKDLTSLITIDLDIKSGIVFDPEDVSKRHENRGFLAGITIVRDMIISRQTVEALDSYSKVGTIPKFNNLSRLEAVFPSSSFQLLPVLLEKCPNLKHLIWIIKYTAEETEAFQFINVSRCVVSTLECVEIEGFLDWEEEELNIATYFLENSAVLRKLVLRFAHVTYPRPSYVTDSDIYEELNNLIKRSQGCQILIDYAAM